MKEPPAAKDDDGRAKLYADIAHPINSICREMIQQRVIQAFEEEKARSKLPGYVPSYEDFEPETIAPPAASRPTPTVTTQIQGAEKPRGPHKIPVATAAAATSDRRPHSQRLRRGRLRSGHVRVSSAPVDGSHSVTLWPSAD